MIFTYIDLFWLSEEWEKSFDASYYIFFTSISEWQPTRDTCFGFFAFWGFYLRKDENLGELYILSV